MTGIEKQKSNVDHLFNLIKANPKLKIVPMVSSEIVGGDDFSSWLGEWGSARIDYIHQPDWNDKRRILDPERIYFHSDDEEFIKEMIYDYFEKSNPAWSDTYIEEQMNDEYQNYLEWEEVIVVNINYP